jgi:hypothetical protein
MIPGWFAKQSEERRPRPIEFFLLFYPERTMPEPLQAREKS